MTARVTDHNGWFTVPRNPLSKAGVFPYTKKSTQAPGWESDPDGIVMVYRPESELADPETVNSFKLLPWINDHQMLGDPEDNPALTPPEQKGVHGTTGEQIEYDPSDRTLYGNLKLWSRSLGDAIDAGKKQLSMGFRCVYEHKAGNFEGRPFQAIQRKIRGNHPASVDLGRMGPDVAVLDSMSFGFDAAELREIKPMKKVARRVNIAAKLGCAPDALMARFGMDGADDAAKKIFNAAMDAEEDAEGDTSDKGGQTLQEIVDVVKAAAEPMAELQEAIASMAGGGAAGEDPDAVDDPAMDDTMEPVVDSATGQQKMGADGKPMFQKKAAAQDIGQKPALGVAADKTMTAGCDAAIASAELHSKTAHKLLAGRAAPAELIAFDAAIANVKTARAKVKVGKVKPKGATGMDAAIVAINKRLDAIQPAPSVKSVMADIAARDNLYKAVSPFIGAFDHAEMTTADLAVYACDKLEIKTPKGQEATALAGYLTGRQPSPRRETYGFDAANIKPVAAVSEFVAGSAR
jgi:hypothetical protein